MKTTISLFAFAAFALTSGCASMDQKGEDAAAIALTAEEVVAHVSGKTEQWSEGAAFYAADNAMEVLWKGEEASGTWLVKDAGELCFTTVLFDNKEECHSYQREGDTINLVYNGKTQTLDVKEGNHIDYYR